MSTSAENRGQFGSKLGFILSAAGSAVGLGNIWKFPGKAYFCGGGAFLIIYLIIVALVGTTVMMAEFTVGRKTHKNAVGAMRELNAKWSWVGGLGVLTGFIILCYYCQVGGWTMNTSTLTLQKQRWYTLILRLTSLACWAQTASLCRVLLFSL